MKKRISVIVLALVLSAIILSSCRARTSCPGVYSHSTQVEKTVLPK